ncbi:hypothetical protein GCM10009682_48920 [Luedemannella flava]|uniref:Uncharacterized protein n=1 Tax=Luedemannella flava TaxID=349316 RepID=A0ABP4YLK4_9ACTN
MTASGERPARGDKGPESTTTETAERAVTGATAQRLPTDAQAEDAPQVKDTTQAEDGPGAADAPRAAPPRALASPLPRAPGDGPGVKLFADAETEKKEPRPAEEPGLSSWRRFAPQGPKPPTRAARVGRRLAPVGRFLTHEWTLVCLGGLALAVLMTWPTLRDPASTLPEDLGDPTLVAYLISWGGHALLNDPAHLWHLNAFYPSSYGLAFSDSFLGYAPFAFFGTGPEAALIRYNIIYVLILALAFIGLYALARQLGAGRLGSAVGAAAFALAPWRLGQAGHLHVISTGGIALAFAMLARGHGIRFPFPRRQPDEEAPVRTTRPGWAFAGWLVATWQITIGFGIGLVFAYVLLGTVAVSVVRWLWSRPGWRPFGPGWPSRRLLLADVTGGLIFAGISVAMAMPYLKVLELYPQARRTEASVAYFSPPLRGYFTSPPESQLWGPLHETSRSLLQSPAEMDLLPGFTLYALAIAGVVFSIWSLRTRLLLAAGVILTIYLGMGTNAPGQGYLLLYRNLPGFDGLRTPGRLVVWTTLLLALLAAGAVTALGRQAVAVARVRGHYDLPGLARFALVVPLALVLIEGRNITPHPTMPAQPAALREVPGPVLLLPSTDLPDMHVMLWTTDRFVDLANGASGFLPTELAQIRLQTKTFPDAGSVQYLRKVGIATVVVVPRLARGTPWAEPETLNIDGLGITREVRTDGTVVFDLSAQ